MFFIGRLSFLAVLLCFGCTYAVTPEDESRVKEALHPFVIECTEEYGITEEQFEEAKKEDNAKNIDPCFMSCFMKKADFFDSEGKFDVEKTITFAKSHLESESTIKFFETVAEECVKVNDEEVSDGEKGCDRAKLLFSCIREVKEKMDD